MGYFVGVAICALRETKAEKYVFYKKKEFVTSFYLYLFYTFLYNTILLINFFFYIFLSVSCCRNIEESLAGLPLCLIVLFIYFSRSLPCQL